MSKLPVQKVLLEIAAAPRSREFIEAGLAGTGVAVANLESLGLIKKRGDNYAVAFSLMTKADEQKVCEVTEARAHSLSEAFLKRRTEIETILRAYDMKGADPKAVAYLLLGCFALDWDGLNLTQENNYRVAAPERPNGDHYTPWAREKNELILKGLFWGSHNDYQPDSVLTSFGDHFSVPRAALPDLFMRVPSRAIHPEMPMPLKRRVFAVVNQALAVSNRRAGLMMLALRDGEKNGEALAKAAGIKKSEADDLLGLLVELEYVETKGDLYRSRIPVFAERDKPMVVAILHLGREVMGQWLATNYEPMKTELSNITPSREGVPYAEGFTQIWHYVFGAANRQLVEAGLFANPYSDEQKHKGFIPTVWHPSLNPDVIAKADKPRS